MLIKDYSWRWIAALIASLINHFVSCSEVNVCQRTSGSLHLPCPSNFISIHICAWLVYCQLSSRRQSRHQEFGGVNHGIVNLKHGWWVFIRVLRPHSSYSISVSDVLIANWSCQNLLPLSGNIWVDLSPFAWRRILKTFCQQTFRRSKLNWSCFHLHFVEPAEGFGEQPSKGGRLRKRAKNIKE